MATQHPYHELLIQISKGLSFEFQASENTWLTLTGDQVLANISTNNKRVLDSIRVISKTVLIGNTQVPEPMQVAPPMYSCYWYLEDLESQSAYADVWHNDFRDNRRLNMGICHETHSAAVKHMAALIALTALPSHVTTSNEEFDDSEDEY